MTELKFRELRADELQVRPTDTAIKGYAELLIYKDSRCDQRILDEVVGPFGWAKQFKDVNGVTYCGVALCDSATGIWVWKWDAGAESNFEKEKGTASDAFKRACFNWGIGRSLYTCPKVRIKCPDEWYKNERLTMTFRVSEIDYLDGKVTTLVIVDRSGNVVFEYRDGRVQKQTSAPVYEKSLDGAKKFVEDKWDTDDHKTLSAFFTMCKGRIETLEKYGPQSLYNFLLKDIREGKVKVVRVTPPGVDQKPFWTTERIK